jgi:hypothetical protein
MKMCSLLGEVFLAAASVLSALCSFIWVLLRPARPSLGALALCVLTARPLVAIVVVKTVCTCSKVRSRQHWLGPGAWQGM